MTIQAPPEEILEIMGRLALEQATEALAQMAERLAVAPHIANVSGPDALKAFANAIRATNKEHFKVEGAPS